jgi:hypothetical protein
MNRISRFLLLSGSLGLFLLQTPLRGQEVPSPSQILGYELGEKFTPVGGISHYFSALAEASDRVSVHPFGRSVEGRPLLQVLVATPDQRGRLEEILELNRELTDPETSRTRADEIIRTNPAVVYLSYGVHGIEASSSEAAMWTAYDLARGAEDVARAKALRTREEREDDRWAQAVPRTILTVSPDPRHPLAAGGIADGLTNEMFVLSRGRAFEPSNGFESVAFFPEDLSKISGVITEESLDRLGQSSWPAQIGVGRVRRKVSPGPNH